MRQLLLPFDQQEGPARRSRSPMLLCVYCGSAASTKDHVPPKALLEKPFPVNLRTVPACRSCNGGWSLDEEYMAVVLAQVGHHPHLMQKVESGGVIDRALSASPGLDEAITSALQVAPDGRVWFQPDLGRISKITTKLAFGLFCLKYGQGAVLRDFSTHWLSGPGAEIPQRLLAAHRVWPGIRRKRRTIVQEGVFSFIFARGWMADDPPLYCMMNFHETIFAAVSCPAPIGRKADKRLRSQPWK
jgi:hypothetical protein